MSMMLPHRRNFSKTYWMPRRLVQAFLQHDFRDSSWGRDVCPSFSSNDGRFVVWCDGKAPARNRGQKRYAIYDCALEVGIAEFDQTDILVQWLETCFPRSTDTPTFQ